MQNKVIEGQLYLTDTRLVPQQIMSFYTSFVLCCRFVSFHQDPMQSYFFFLEPLNNKCRRHQLRKLSCDLLIQLIFLTAAKSQYSLQPGPQPFLPHPNPALLQVQETWLPKPSLQPVQLLTELSELQGCISTCRQPASLATSCLRFRIMHLCKLRLALNVSKESKISAAMRYLSGIYELRLRKFGI